MQHSNLTLSLGKMEELRRLLLSGNALGTNPIKSRRFARVKVSNTVL